MNVRIAVVVCLWLALGGLVLVGAADFWEAKPSARWSAAEVEAMLDDSPWARRVWVYTPNVDLAARVGGLSGGVVGAGVGARSGVGAGGGGVAGAGAGNLGGGTFLAPPERTRLTVRWASALPVRQAVARRDRDLGASSGAGAPSDLDPQDEEEPFYRVAVARVPTALTAAVAGIDAVQQGTTLRVGDRTTLIPVNVRLRYEDDLLVIESRFSRADPIRPTDREVEFVMVLGAARIKKTFALDEMMFHGRLAL